MTRRLLFSYLTITLIVLVLLEVPLALFFQQREGERFVANAERDAVVLASFYEDSVQHGTTPAQGYANDYADKARARVVLVDVDGISVLDTARDPGRDYSTRNEVAIALAGQRSGGVRHSETLGQDLLYVAVPVASAGTVYGALRLTLDAHEVTESIHKFWTGLALVGLVILLAVAVIGWTIARSVSRPIRTLSASATRFAEGDLTPTEELGDAPSEIRELGASMNFMARRLDEQIEAQRAFVGDASHQLRTPLAALRLRLENLESDLTEANQKEDVAQAIAETGRLTEIVNSLLRLARAERAPAIEPIQIGSLVRERIDTWSALAEAAYIELVLEDQVGELDVMAGSGVVEQILDNLLDNAINASPGGNIVAVELRRNGERVTLSVRDQGVGLSDENKQKALERFWSGSDDSHGSGLGLAIVRSLIRSSGGQLRLEDNRPRGLVASVDFAVSTRSTSSDKKRQTNARV